MEAMMKYLLSLLTILLIFSCQTGRGEPIYSENPEQWNENPINSPYVEYYFQYLEEYLEGPMPDVLPLEVEKAYVRQGEDSYLMMICSYSERGKQSWLKATLLINSEGEVRGKEIVASYQIDLLEEEF